MAVADERFRVMASAAQVLVVDAPDGLTAQARERLEQLEQAWSRFIPFSDISRLNAAAGIPVTVGADTLLLVTTMVEAWHLTGGRYDPTTLPALVTSGYGSSIDDHTKTTKLPIGAEIGGDPDRIQIDPVTSTVTLPANLTLDPGGIGKGLAADITAGFLLEHGAKGALVSIGGDLVAIGRAPDPRGWFVTVEDPWTSDADLCTLQIDGGGVATSSTLTRRWDHDGHRYHHLIDPDTGIQSDTDLAAVTVVAATGWQAEALATATLLGGSERALDYLTAHDAQAIAVTNDGELLSTLVET